MEKYVNLEKLKSFFKARNRDLFSADTICSILDLIPDEDCIVAEVEEYMHGYKEIEDRIQQEDNLNKVCFLDEKGPGGAYHKYIILNGRTEYFLGSIMFQIGPRNDPKSIQGVLDTDLLEIVRHRMKAFCEGDMADENTKNALYCIEGALGFLRRRTEDRKKRGVLGTMEK